MPSRGNEGGYQETINHEVLSSDLTELIRPTCHFIQTQGINGKTKDSLHHDAQLAGLGRLPMLKSSTQTKPCQANISETICC